jgi:hypothetical protein
MTLQQSGGPSYNSTHTPAAVAASLPASAVSLPRSLLPATSSSNSVSVKMSRNQPFFHPPVSSPAAQNKVAHGPNDAARVGLDEAVSASDAQAEAPAVASSCRGLASQGPATVRTRHGKAAAPVTAEERAREEEHKRPVAPPQNVTVLVFQGCRAQAVREGGFLRYEVLERLLKERMGYREFHMNVMARELCNGMRRMLATVNVAVDAVIATHNIITIHDLENTVILRLRDFAEGNACHPKP